MKKYELMEETKILSFGTVLHRIRAVRDFMLVYGTNIKAGDLGGWVEKEGNLSHNGSAWVCGEASVFGDARIYGEAQVYDNALVSGKAQIFGDKRSRTCTSMWDVSHMIIRDVDKED